MTRSILTRGALAALVALTAGCGASSTALTEVRAELKGRFAATSEQLTKAETWKKKRVTTSPDGVEPRWSNQCFTLGGRDETESGHRCYKLVGDAVYRRTVLHIEPAEAALARFRRIWDAYGADPKYAIIYALPKDAGGMPCAAEFDGVRMKPMFDRGTVLTSFDEPAAREAFANARLCASAQNGTGNGVRSVIALGPHVLDDDKYEVKYTDWSSDQALRKRAAASRDAMAAYQAEQKRKKDEEAARRKAEAPPSMDATGLPASCLKMKRCIDALAVKMPQIKGAYEKAWLSLKAMARGPKAASVGAACTQALAGYVKVPGAPAACR